MDRGPKYLIVSLLLLQNLGLLRTVSGCHSRSGEDTDRVKVYSHQGTEPTFEKETPGGADASANAADEANDADDETREREQGELKVGKKWEFPVAQTKVGMLWGTIEESRSGKRILAFRGIKHVQPPVEGLRFRPPVFTPKWDGIVEAKTNGHMCPQHLASKPDIWVGDEDCLWLNVFTRDLVVSKKRPVIVWIHGGSFSRGSASEYDPDFLLDDEVVLVTIQYRLGMFGFLSTESAEAPGNYGMLDQVAALQWIKQNIEAFSGDPNSITIMGQQAGGASVHYHMLSPITRGLFNRAVSMSGSALAWWASIKRPQEKAKRLGRLLECGDDAQDNMEKLVECVRGKPMFDLMNTHPNFYTWKHLEQTQEPLTSWSPRVDPESSISFLPQEPIDLMTSGNFQHIPWIVGLTDDEGATRSAAFFADPAGVVDFDENFDKYGPLMFGFHDGQAEAPKVMAKKVKDFYLGDKRMDQESAGNLVDAISDSSYAHPIDTAAKIHALKSAAPVFVYHFGYRGKHSLAHIKPNTYPPELQQPTHHYGVGNGDDLMYLFPVHWGIFRPFPSDDIMFSIKFSSLLTTFARTGRPEFSMGEGESPFEWQRADPNNISHLNIGNHIRMDQGLPNHRRMSFWQSLPVYWNADRSNYKPAPPIVRKSEL